MTAVCLFCNFFCFDDRLFKVGGRMVGGRSTAGTMTAELRTDARRHERQAAAERKGFAAESEKQPGKHFAP